MDSLGLEPSACRVHKWRDTTTLRTKLVIGFLTSLSIETSIKEMRNEMRKLLWDITIANVASQLIKMFKQVVIADNKLLINKFKSYLPTHCPKQRGLILIMLCWQMELSEWPNEQIRSLHICQK